MSQTITLVLDDSQGSLSEFNDFMAQTQQRICDLENENTALKAKVPEFEAALSDVREELSALKAGMHKAADALDD